MAYKDRNDGRLLKRLYKEKQKGFYRCQPKPSEKERREQKMSHHIKMISEREFKNAPKTHPNKPTMISQKKKPRSSKVDESEGEGDEEREEGEPRPSTSAQAAKKEKKVHPAAQVGEDIHKLHPNIQALKVSSIADECGIEEITALHGLTFIQLYTMLKWNAGSLTEMFKLTAEQLATLETTIEKASKGAEKECKCEVGSTVGCWCRK